MNKRFRPALGTRIVARNRVEKHRVKDGWHEVGWQEWFLAKEGHK